MRLLACIFALFPSLSPPQAHAMHDLFEAGVTAYQDGSYLEAIDDFEAAYELGASAALEYNIAVCYEKLDDPCEAAHYFERYLEEASSPPDGAAVLARMDALQATCDGQ